MSLILELAYLYPKLLNIYGDRGNVLTLSFRCQARGINLNVTAISPNEDLQGKNFDIFFMGGGQDQQQVLVSNDLQMKKKELKRKDLKSYQKEYLLLLNLKEMLN